MTAADVLDAVAAPARRSRGAELVAPAPRAALAGWPDGRRTAHAGADRSRCWGANSRAPWPRRSASAGPSTAATPPASIEARGRTGRKPTDGASARRRGRPSAREDRRYAEPTWTQRRDRAPASPSVMLFVLFQVGARRRRAADRDVARARPIAAFLIYMPLGYKIDRMFWRRRMRKAGRPIPQRRQALSRWTSACFTVGPVQENCFIAAPRRRRPGDRDRPRRRGRRGCSRRSTSSASRSRRSCSPTRHFDHVGAVAPVARATGAPVYCPELEVPVLADIMTLRPVARASARSSPTTPTRRVEGGETLELAGFEIDVLFTPGHRPGHVTYSIAGRAGDLLRRRALPGLDRPHRPARRRPRRR